MSTTFALRGSATPLPGIGSTTMTYPDARDLPEALHAFALIPAFDDRVDELATMASSEDWEYQNSPSAERKPILRNYLRYTYRRIAEEGKVAFTDDDAYSCWNTGLVTSHQEPIYMAFNVNRLPDRRSYWHFSRFVRRGHWELTKFQRLPEMANYFNDPSLLVYDARKELRANVEHIIAENRDRFPTTLQSMPDYGLQNLVKGAIDSAIERVKRNYKTAIPQYYNGTVQLLLPLCLVDSAKADLALVIDRIGDFYRAATCLTLDMAYNNARQLAKPDRDWLQP
jgi:hypothetical protein